MRAALNGCINRQVGKVKPRWGRMGQEDVCTWAPMRPTGGLKPIAYTLYAVRRAEARYSYASTPALGNWLATTSMHMPHTHQQGGLGADAYDIILHTGQAGASGESRHEASTRLEGGKPPS